MNTILGFFYHVSQEEGSGRVFPVNYRDTICAAESYCDPSFWRLESILDNFPLVTIGIETGCSILP